MGKWKIRDYTKNEDSIFYSSDDIKRIRDLISDYCFNHDLNLFDDCPELLEIIKILE